MYISVKPANLQFGLEPNDLPFLEGRKHVWFSLGRQALQGLVKVLGMGEGDNVLVPAYICDVAIPPFETQGVEVRYFDINSDFTPNFEAAENLINSRTKVMLVIHYFGFPQPILSIKDLCRKNKLFLIEDCAHVFGSRYDGSYLGTFGDGAIFSPRKFLALTSGGILSVAEQLNVPGFVCSHSFLDFRGMGRLWLEDVSFRAGTDILLKTADCLLHKVAGRSTMSKETKSGADNRLTGISSADKWLLRRVKYHQLIRKRMENYLYLDNLVRKLPFAQPVFDSLPEEVVPLAFPVLIDSSLTDKFRSICRVCGSYFWPRLPDFGKRAVYENALYFSRHVLLLPVHQELGHGHLEFIVRILKRSAAGDN